MEVKESLKRLHDRIHSIKQKITTEEATKNALILPFIQVLGYDIFNPLEVVPEYTADIGNKKGEKVDYALIIDNLPYILIECKHWKENLDRHNTQLHRYFNVTKARFGILTNGILYEFYTDIEKPNIMDKNPFLQINLNELKEVNMLELSKFHKNNFDLDKILNSASSLKYIKALRNEFEKEIQTPSDELTKMLAYRCFEGKLTSKRLKAFKGYTQRAITLSIKDEINSRLKKALEKEEQSQEKEIAEAEEPQSKIVTTEEELDAFRIVVAILRRKIPVNRISYKDTQSYFAILLDNKTRKPICRIDLDGRKKYLYLFDENKNTDKKLINSIDDIYLYDKQLIATVGYYDDTLK